MRESRPRARIQESEVLAEDQSFHQATVCLEEIIVAPSFPSELLSATAYDAKGFASAKGRGVLSRSRGVRGIEGEEMEEEEWESLSEEEHREGVEGDLGTMAEAILSVVVEFDGLTKTMGELENGRI